MKKTILIILFIISSLVATSQINYNTQSASKKVKNHKTYQDKVPQWHHYIILHEGGGMKYERSMNGTYTYATSNTHITYYPNVVNKKYQEFMISLSYEAVVGVKHWYYGPAVTISGISNAKMDIFARVIYDFFEPTQKFQPYIKAGLGFSYFFGNSVEPSSYTFYAKKYNHGSYLSGNCNYSSGAYPAIKGLKLYMDFGIGFKVKLMKNFGIGIGYRAMLIPMYKESFDFIRKSDQIHQFEMSASKYGSETKMYFDKSNSMKLCHGIEFVFCL